MNYRIYSTGCPTCGQDKKIINQTRRILQRGYHTVQTFNGKWDKQASQEHSAIVAGQFGVYDSRPTVLVRDGDNKAILLANATEADIYGIMV